MPKMLARPTHKQVTGYILRRNGLPKHKNKCINKAPVNSGILLWLMFTGEKK